jgi:hypothetical protein
MAVGVVMDFEGATLEQYDRVVEKMGFTPRGAGAAGGIFHWVTETDRGIRVTDVWSSREAFEEFAQAEIGPYTREVGIEAAPRVTMYDVHSYLTEG